MTPGSLLARVVEEPLPDVLPERLGAIHAHRIGLLHFDDTVTSTTSDPQHVLLDWR